MRDDEGRAWVLGFGTGRPLRWFELNRKNGQRAVASAGRDAASQDAPIGRIAASLPPSLPPSLHAIPALPPPATARRAHAPSSFISITVVSSPPLPLSAVRHPDVLVLRWRNCLSLAGFQCSIVPLCCTSATATYVCTCRSQDVTAARCDAYCCETCPKINLVDAVFISKPLREICQNTLGSGAWPTSIAYVVFITQLRTCRLHISHSPIRLRLRPQSCSHSANIGFSRTQTPGLVEQHARARSQYTQVSRSPYARVLPYDCQPGARLGSFSFHILVRYHTV